MARKLAIGLFFIVAVADLLAMLFSFSMLSVTLSEVTTPGSHDALIGVLAFASVALPVALFLLLATLGGLAIRSIPLWTRIVPILLVSLGLLANLASLYSVSRDVDNRKHEFMHSKQVYASGLHEAVEKGDTSSVKSILGRNPQSIPKLLHESDYEQLEPLHIAIERKDRRMVELLLSYKSNDDFYGDIVNSGSRGHERPLHYAVKAGDAAIVRLLIDRGA